MNTRFLAFVGVFAGALAVGAAPARSATIVQDNSLTDTIPGVATFTTYGSDMAGMSVTATFAGGFSQTLDWATTGAQTGGVSGTGWSLSVSGDTFSNNAWSFANSRMLMTGGQDALTTLVLDGAPGFTLFDILATSVGTPGSALGKPFASSLTNDSSVVATYSHEVAVGANAPVGDLYHLMTVDFTGITGGGATGNFTFSQDTDNDVRRFPVPEPATLAIFAFGLAGLGFMLRRQRRA